MHYSSTELCYALVEEQTHYGLIQILPEQVPQSSRQVFGLKQELVEGRRQVGGRTDQDDTGHNDIQIQRQQEAYTQPQTPTADHDNNDDGDDETQQDGILATTGDPEEQDDQQAKGRDIVGDYMARIFSPPGETTFATATGAKPRCERSWTCARRGVEWQLISAQMGEGQDIGKGFACKVLAADEGRSARDLGRRVVAKGVVRGGRREGGSSRDQGKVVSRCLGGHPQLPTSATPQKLADNLKYANDWGHALQSQDYQGERGQSTQASSQCTRKATSLLDCVLSPCHYREH
ncbi:uncharacterized protein BDZ83DRAFT_649132 [Colletotrichum acutatum]|uniref:Uncharacterized protein n=1 Tax=Glomerella acutata TaxID=27357 RepID=A0AAD8XJW6_GLOAC|nr:uncharacterized protein BDZ83DRAFT_649132 [Colletotrichum acutatum]KAK1728025.1 hypothetical protein BDZ83DRAFT_649132 [Colletotrichum acutatum]